MPFPSIPRLFNAILPRLTPYKDMGVAGTPVYAGYVLSPERSSKLIGQEKYRTYSDILSNTSIVAAGMRYFLNIVARPSWSCEPADQSDEAKAAAEFVEDVFFEQLHTPWSRIVRRCSTYRFYGFAIQEWTADKRDDGKIGFKDIEARPQWTVWRWEVDERGAVIGLWQRDPLTGRELGLPRGKLMYLVDDTLTDNPEGMGLLRHVVEPVERLKEYQKQEGYGFLRDLRGVPIGRAPIDDLEAAVKQGIMSKEQKDKAIETLMDFVRLEKKGTETGILLSSQPYVDRTDTGNTMATQYKWGVELANGAAPGLSDVANAITRINNEIARILGIEHLMLGATAAGSFALAKEKASNLYLLANSVLRDVRLQAQHDLLWPLWSLNGFDDKLMPKFKSEDVAPKDVAQITGALQSMAMAGAPMLPNDEAINWVRDLMGAPSVDVSHYDDYPELLQQPPEVAASVGGGAEAPPLPWEQKEQDKQDKLKALAAGKAKGASNDNVEEKPKAKVKKGANGRAEEDMDVLAMLAKAAEDQVVIRIDDAV